MAALRESVAIKRRKSCAKTVRVIMTSSASLNDCCQLAYNGKFDELKRKISINNDLVVRKDEVIIKF